MNRKTSTVLATAVGAGLLAAATLAAQRIPAGLTNADLQQRAVPSGLEQVFNGLVATRQAPGWIAWSVGAVPGDHRSCGSGRDDVGVRLEPARHGTGARPRVALEGPSQILVFFRAEQGRVQKVRVISPDCDIDAGGLPVHWLTDVDPKESVSLLASFARDFTHAPHRALGDGALTALALHRDASALGALRRFAAAGQPRELRKQAAFWLAAARGREGFEAVQALLHDSDPAFRAELTVPVFVSKEPGAVDVLVRMARGDESAKVRRQALFWLGQKAGAKAVATIEGAIENDPDPEVKKRAVFALSQMPKDEGVPRLMEIARSHRNLEVRRQAMFWLGQSNDPHALAFFEEILKR